MASTPGGEAPAEVPTEDSRITLARVMGVMDANIFGNVHGGVIMRAVDEAGAMSSMRHSGGPVVTAFMDQMAFLEPMQLGDVLITRAQVNWTGKTSMEVGVRVSAQRLSMEEEIHVSTAYLVFVAVDADGRPRHVARVRPGNDLDRMRWHEAEIRRRARLERRQAIKDLRAKGIEP